MISLISKHANVLLMFVGYSRKIGELDEPKNGAGGIFSTCSRANRSAQNTHGSQVHAID
jgi:hypothetical protein